MRKTDKKIENQLRVVLTQVCDIALKEIQGFQWLTHQCNYAKFPQSLLVICVFDNNDNLKHFIAQRHNNTLESLITNKLQSIGIKLKNSASHIRYDTEENCTQEHKGNWALRLA